MKNEVLTLIEMLGINDAAKEVSSIINQKITSENIAMQFVLEEIEAASQGNDLAKYFALNSGFDEDDYIGAMNNSFEEVDGVESPQEFILAITTMLHSDINLMVDFRTKIVDNIMKEWKLGKYAPINNQQKLVSMVQKINNTRDGVFGNINNDLNDFSATYEYENNILMKMAYAYARRSVAAGLFLQGVFSREDYQQASTIFKILQRQTGQSVEFQQEASNQALELLFSYSSRLTNTMISNIVTVVELEQVKSAYEYDTYYQFNDVLDFFEEEEEEFPLVDYDIYHKFNDVFDFLEEEGEEIPF